jgi:hypothetical protein
LIAEAELSIFIGIHTNVVQVKSNLSTLAVYVSVTQLPNRHCL